MSVHSLTRRTFLGLCVTAATATLFARMRLAAAETFDVTKTESEWKDKLTPEQFKVMREQGTEPPGSSPLDHQFAMGVYNCAACDLPLFMSETKFDSYT